MVSQQKEFANESPRTKRAREKLKRKLESIDEKITPVALERKTIEIHRWIDRHATNRIVLRSKAISLFDENKNTAKASQRILNLTMQLRNATYVS